MHVIVWAFEVKPSCEQQFERAYGPHGDWARFFELGAGYLGTELLRAPGERRYLTIDRWQTREAYEAFRAAQLADYEKIDRGFERLTEREEQIGAFEQVP